MPSAEGGLLFPTPVLARLREADASAGGVADKLVPFCQTLRARADALLERPLVPEAEADQADTQHGNYDRPSTHIADLGLTAGLAWAVTGEQRYARGLRAALLHYTGYAKWFGRGLRRNDPPWQAELNTARFCFGVATGYDFLGAQLSAGERRQIAAGLIRLGILPTLEDWVLPDRRIHALDSMGHNWWSVCISQAGLAALALVAEEHAAAGWARAAGEALDLWFSYSGFALQNKSPNFDPAGAFYESVGYANYGLAEYLLFRLAHARVLGRPTPIPLLERVGATLAHTCYPTGGGVLSVDFGDSSLRGNAGRTATLLLANGYDDPALRWYAARTHRPQDPLVLLAPDPEEAPATPDGLGRSVLYPEIGWAVLRSAWSDDATLLAVKCGFTWNHAHADAGSFILLHAGQPLVIDSGTCAYGLPEYHAYYCQSRAHNVVLVDGQGQPSEDIIRGVPRPGRLGPLLELGDQRYLCADATGPMGHLTARNYRHFLWLGEAILVVDDVRAHRPARLEWLLHTQGSVRHSGQGGMIVTNGGAELHVLPLHPTGLVQTEQQGMADHHPDQAAPYHSFALPGAEREAKFVTAFLPRGPVPVEVEAIAGDEWIGARLIQGEDETDVYLNLRADGRRMHRNSNHVISGWDTDAYLFAVSRPRGTAPERCTRMLIAGGSYLRRDGRVWFSSLAKLFVAANWEEPGLEVRLQGQPEMRGWVGARFRPAQVTCNGTPVTCAYDEDLQACRLVVSTAGNALDPRGRHGDAGKGEAGRGA